MTPAVLSAILAVATAAAATMLAIREAHFRALDARVAKVIGAGDRRPARLRGVATWLSIVGSRYRRFYSPEDLSELRAVLQASGFNPHRTLSIWVGAKIVSLLLLPLVALVAAELAGSAPANVLIATLMGAAAGVVGPRLLLSALRRRFAAAVRKGTPDTIDLLVVCSEAGMGLESALERVAHEMNRSNPPMALVLSRLLDDLRILPNRRAAFEKLGAASDALMRFGTMMNQSLQYGTPLSQALRAIADELRRDSINQLEARAHKLGAKLTMPMVVFLLPAMFVILGASPFMHLIRALKGG